MTKRFRQFLAVPAVLALCDLGGCGFGSAQYTRVLTAQPTIPTTPAATAYKISTGNGYIRVSRSTSGKLEISADAALQTPERRDAFALRTEAQGGTFVIEPVWPEGKALNSERCAFTIAIPEAAGLTLSTSNGEIVFGGFSGPVSADTSNGAITVTGHDGAATLKTSNGAIKATDLTSSAEARTSNGAISLAFTPASVGPVVAKTSNGGITLELPEHFPGVMTLQTSNGRITTQTAANATAEVRKTSGKITFKDSGSASSAETSNGSITVRQSTK